MSQEALNTYLRPIQPLLADPAVHEISINRPGELWFTQAGKLSHTLIESLNFEHLRTLASLIATHCEQDISEQRPLLSATLPDGYRVQVVIPPACLPGHVIISIRRQTLLNLNITDYARYGAFDRLNAQEPDTQATQLRQLYKQGDFQAFLIRAVQQKQNILIAGGTDTGKTTFLNACIAEIPENERLVTIEDSAEVQPPHANRAALFYSRGDQGVSTAGAQELLEASLRLRPDRIILGELRGAEAFTFLRAINTGHEGSMTSLHADTPQLAFHQLALMVLQAGLGMTRDEIEAYIRSIIDVVVQLKRDAHGQRYISEVYYTHAA